MSLPSHLKVPWGIDAAIVTYLLAWIGFTFILIMLIGFVSPYLPAASQFLDGLQRNDVQASFILVIVNAIIAFGLVALYLKRYKVGFDAVGWRGFSLFKAALYLLAIFVVFVVGSGLLIYLVSVLVPGFDSNQAQSNEFISSTASNPRLTLIALVIIPPIIEETVFRGFIFPAFAKRWGVIWGAIISSVMFGFAHLQANVGVYTFLLGMLLCFLYVKLKSIIPGIFFHMLNNYLAFVALSGK